MSVEVDGPVEEYLAGVRAALHDLPAGEVTEIVDDVRGHLADVQAEVGADADLAALSARLGSPATYAAELRAAADYPPAPKDGTGRDANWALLAVLALAASSVLVVLALGAAALGVGAGLGTLLLAVVVLLGAVPALVRGGPGMPEVAELPVVRRAAAALPAPRGVAGFVVTLQPAWWVLRALVAAALMAEVFGREPAVWLLVAVMFVPLSVYLGYLSRRDRRWLWPVVPLNVLAAVLAPFLVGPFAPAAQPYAVYDDAAPPYFPGLWQDAERQITDIRPVDSSGNPLSGVYLFDQDSRAIDTGDECTGYGAYGDRRPASAPYPRGTAEYDGDTGECRVVPPVPLVVAVPSAVPTPVPATPAPPPVTGPGATAPTTLTAPAPSPAPPTG